MAMRDDQLRTIYERASQSHARSGDNVVSHFPKYVNSLDQGRVPGNVLLSPTAVRALHRNQSSSK